MIKEKLELKEGVTFFDSPIGIIEIKSNDGMIVSVKFVDEKLYMENENEVLVESKKQLKEYFFGERKIFTLPIKIDGTEFRKKVWNTLLKIPYGKTCSYKDIAIKIGNEKASRAVGGANNKNKIAIIIPCHRVIGSNGKMVGYEGGMWRKEWLLKHESKINSKKEKEY